MRKFRGLAVSLVSVIISITLVELFLWFVAPVPDPYEKYYKYKELNQYIKWERKRNERLITELEEELPGADGQNVNSTNNMGFRGDHLTVPKPENEFRIFILGPSNAECFYLDDSESIDAVLQRELSKHLQDNISIKVYNAAQSATNSDDIISMIVHRIVHLQPDMIILFSADLYAPLRDHDYLHYLKESPKKKFPLIHFLATEFQIPRRIYYFFKHLSPTEQELFETISLKSQYLQVIEKFRAAPISNLKPKTNIPAFSNNLKTIIGVTNAHNIQLVFMTPQTTWNSKVDPKTKNYHWSLLYGGTRYQEDLMHEAVELYNEEIRRLSVKYNLPIVDLAKIIPKSTEYFYDDVHFNKKGADFTARHLASFILQEGLIQH